MSRMLRQWLTRTADNIETLLNAQRVQGRISGGTVRPGFVRFSFMPAAGNTAAAVQQQEAFLRLWAPDLRVCGLEVVLRNPDPLEVTAVHSAAGRVIFWKSHRAYRVITAGKRRKRGPWRLATGRIVTHCPFPGAR